MTARDCAAERLCAVIDRALEFGRFYGQVFE
jgi:hypothetical protein